MYRIPIYFWQILLVANLLTLTVCIITLNGAGVIFVSASTAYSAIFAYFERKGNKYVRNSNSQD